MAYKHTRYASYLGYITQAIVNNLAPLLFVTFQKEFEISMAKISLLIIFNFGTQIITDIIAAKYIDYIGYRTGAVLAHIFCTIGLISLGVLPNVLPNPYIGLVIAMIINAIGGGLIEVLISPIIESLPGEEKEAAMSLLHSFYCWGQVAVVLLSTLFFTLIGTRHWYILPLLWSLIPFGNVILFLKVPLCKLVEEELQIPIKQLMSKGLFWVFILLMICAGASELAMSQWSSMFAEAGLQVSKTVGDLLGPCAFAILMGLSRVFYGIKGSKIDLKKALIFSSSLCVISYLLTVFSKNSVISLIGCAMSGLSVGLMWPGIFSLASKYFKNGGTAMFAFLALAGDLGATVSPVLVGSIAERFEGNLKAGLLVGTIFPIVLVWGLMRLKRKLRRSNHEISGNSCS